MLGDCLGPCRDELGVVFHSVFPLSGLEAVFLSMQALLGPNANSCEEHEQVCVWPLPNHCSGPSYGPPNIMCLRIAI